MTIVNLLVSVSQDYLNQMSDVVQNLRSAGMTDIQSLDAIGVVTGSLDDSKIADISNIEGIAQVERSQKAQIQSPNSDIE